MRRLAIFVLALLPALPTHAQEGRRRTLAVNVVSWEGTQVTGLTAADFRGEFKGRPVTVVSVALDTSPRRVAAIADTSGSPKDGGAALLGLTPDHSLALFTLDDSLHKHSDSSNDRLSLQEARRSAMAWDAGGGTSIYDGLFLACRRFPDRRLGDAVYLISDGDDTASDVPSSAAEWALARGGVRVYWVRTPSSMGRARSEGTSDVVETAGGVA